MLRKLQESGIKEENDNKEKEKPLLLRWQARRAAKGWNSAG